MVVEVAFFSLAGVLAARLGAEPMAAHQLALSLATLTFTVAVGIGNAGSIRVGTFVGARDRLGARRAGLTAFARGRRLHGLHRPGLRGRPAACWRAS